MTVLTVYLVALYAVPSGLAIPALGGAGSPSSLVGIALFLWWSWTRIAAGQDVRRPKSGRSVRVCLALFLASALASYVAAMLRAMPAVEASPANTALLRLVGVAGVLLVAADGITDRTSFITFARRLTVAGGFYAALGLLQFVTGRAFVDVIHIPGFASGQTSSNVGARGTFTRAAATASHPLEYAVVLAMLLPIALNFALADRQRSIVSRWWPSAAILLATTLSLSRSALIGVSVGILVLVPSWSRASRRVAAGVAVVLFGAVYVLVPGLAGTVKGLFVGVSSNTTTTSRTGSFDVALDFFGRSPLFGRGLGTFLPVYRILDNQYLLLLVEGGIVGVLTLLALFFSSVFSARATARVSTEPLDRMLSYGLTAAMLPGIVLTAFFDAFSFPQAIGTIFLMPGLCAAVGNVVRRRNTDPDKLAQKAPKRSR